MAFMQVKVMHFLIVFVRIAFLPRKTYENHENPQRIVLEDVFFDLLKQIGAPGANREFWPDAIFHFLTPKSGPKAAKERLGTPQGNQKCPPGKPKIDQESSKTASGRNFCLRTCIYTNFRSFYMPKLQKNTYKNSRNSRLKRENAFV